MQKKNKPTIEDVARLSNVSTATVSRIINGKDKVKEGTKQKVLKVIEDVGFEIRKGNLLSDNDSKTILVCVTELKNPFNVPVIDGIQNSALKYGYDVLLLQTKQIYTEFSDYESVLKAQRFAGVVFLSSVTSAQLKKITDQLNYRCPIVFCSEYIEEMNIPYVAIDDKDAIYKATNYLLSCGRSKIGFINSNHSHNYAKKREAGFKEAMQDSGYTINEHMIVRLSSVNYGLGYSNALYLLGLEERPDALLCISDVFAIGALKACKKKGLRVPEDVAIIGFDNIELSTMTDPSLTTIDQPNYQLGYQSCELLVEKINNPDTLTKQIFLETELIVRDSTPLMISKNKGEQS